MLMAVAAIALLCASLGALPRFESFAPRFPQILFGVCVIGTLPAALVIPFLRHPWNSTRLWLSMYLATMLGAWTGVGIGYWCEVAHADESQWPGIGGALIIWFFGFVNAMIVSTIVAVIFPRWRP